MGQATTIWESDGDKNYNNKPCDQATSTAATGKWSSGQWQKPASMYYLQRQYLYCTNTHQPFHLHPPPISHGHNGLTVVSSILLCGRLEIRFNVAKPLLSRNLIATTVQHEIFSLSLSHTVIDVVISSTTTWQNNGIWQHLAAADVGWWKMEREPRYNIAFYSTLWYATIHLEGEGVENELTLWNWWIG